MTTTHSNMTSLTGSSADGADISQRFALDVQGFDALKSLAAKSPEQGAKLASKQFDAVFTQMMLKSMRAATPSNGPLDSHDADSFTAMLDQQLAQQMSSRGIGVADMMLKQLMRNSNVQGAAGTDGASGAAGLLDAAGAAGGNRADRGNGVLAALRAAGAGSAALANLPIGKSAARLPMGVASGSLPMGTASPSIAAAKQLLVALAGANASSAASALGSDDDSTIASGHIAQDYRSLSALANAYLNPAANGSLARGQGFASNEVQPAPVPSSGAPQHASDFIQKLAAPAQAASAATGIPARFIIGQAALESGWGKSEIKHHDGSSSHNIFGIKATKDWNGPTVSATTTEFVNGRATRTVQKFRAYGSYAEAMTDYAKVLKNNPRFAPVLAAARDVAGFAHGMQKAGYATDPHYAKKLISIMQQMV
jgi:flagellar rod assembly protein/muramidase FlgJ